MKQFCPKTCGFINDDCRSLPLDCWRFGDEKVEPFPLTLHFGMDNKVEVTIVGTNKEFNQWILSDGSRISREAPWITYKK